MLKTKFYRLWANMRNRCNNPNNRSYPHYGGRGIRVCERWDDFANFVEDMYSGYVEGVTTIDRIDVNGPYSPENCRWATKGEQVLNTRRNVFLTHDGLTMTVSQWAARTGMNRRTIEQRVKKGWTPAQVLTTPVQPCNR